MERMIHSDIIIIVDTREQNPYRFDKIFPQPKIMVETLRSGDYSLRGYENNVAVERKTLIDAYGTFGKGRVRFENELSRLSEYDFAAVVIEADWHTIIFNPPVRSQFNPKSFFASVIAWQQRYGVHFWACMNRDFGEKTTYRILERFWRDQSEGVWIGKRRKLKSSTSSI
jgi:ERCC4-type nuclease